LSGNGLYTALWSTSVGNVYAIALNNDGLPWRDEKSPKDV